MTPYSKFDTDIPNGGYDLVVIGTSHICDRVLRAIWGLCWPHHI